MINAEKYKEEISEIANNDEDFGFDVKKHQILSCRYTLCSCCLFKSSWSCQIKKLKWLFSEYKEQLSDDEITILKNINKSYKWIVRDDENLQICTVKPVKESQWWTTYGKCNWGDLSVFNHLFRDVKAEDEKPCNIDDLLKKHGVER